ncbi:PorP/SprF family type IX secretion system membrane protein [Marinifilum caeruleilacunae]|uniref:Type IX secretion system membrane protein PorP/SprF n=1 Tax=Marinifilum caeruleilacunae TaxID=2499076 RepID=A0ABX1WVU7_9BACT|nr:type IX secretion system membrane protein PorP/SprF [Marinifilum caeruleilacunae]NOU60239.1 type IX secretion system membrane protein PorP/SprF [Marinifilum caeruleilacunae]
MNQLYKIAISIAFLLLPILQVRAQEDIRFSNYSYNRLFYNPAYAGSTGFMEAVLAYRNQWVDIEGSPETAVLSVQAPVNFSKFGLGAVVYNNRFGIQKDNAVFLNYAYHLQVSFEGVLSMGIQAGVVNKQINWTDLTTYDPNFPSPDDPAFPDQDISTWVPNFGIGFYYYTPKYYIGLSTPRLLSNDQPATEGFSDNMKFKLKNTVFYLGGGVNFPIGQELKFKPSLLVISSYSGVTTAMTNFELEHESGVSAGVGYRTDDSWAGILGYQLNPKLRFSYSYEKYFGIYGSKGYTNHEIILNYNLSLRKSRITSPRYF